jgi:hypothetical protein
MKHKTIDYNYNVKSICNNLDLILPIEWKKFCAQDSVVAAVQFLDFAWITVSVFHLEALLVVELFT